MAEAPEPKPDAKPQPKPAVKGDLFFGVYRYQKVMFRVVLAAMPALAGAVYFFGWRALAVVLVSVAAGSAAEWLFCRSRREPVSSAVFVSAVLYGLILPPTVPFSVAVIGIVIGIVFGKEVFGGFGRNVFNPAMVGRCFVYVCFPRELTAAWVTPWSGLPGGFAHWAGSAVDAVSKASPMQNYKASAGAEIESLLNLALGNVRGCLGETSAVLILVGGAYLLATKTANWRIMAACVVGLLATSAAFHYGGARTVPPPLWSLSAGGFLFVAVFMATDPVSAAGTNEGRWLYGLGIGFLTVVIRGFSNFTGGEMFAVLIMNTFNPIMDYYVREIKKARKPAAKEAAA